MVENGFEVSETKKILSKLLKPSKDWLSSKEEGVSLFLKDDEKGNSVSGGKDNIVEAIVVTSQMKCFREVS